MTEDAQKSAPSRKPLWRSWSVMVALLLMIGGTVWWIVRPAPQDVPQSAASRSSLTSSLTTTLEPDGALSEDPARFAPSSPATFRLGAGYLGGFFLGWAFRKFLKLMLLIGGFVVLCIAGLQYFGIGSMDWSAVRDHVSQSFAWAQGEAGTFMDFLTGYLPSTGAAAAGIFMGFRRG